MNRAIGRVLAPTLTAAALAGCAASPPVNYYTLLAPEPATPAAARDGQPPYLLEVLPVTVPSQADQPQIMMRQPDGAVSAYYSDRWTAPLPDEIRGALSYNLVRDLGVLDVQTISAPSSAAVWRVQVDVQRFDAAAGGSAVLDATWRVRPVNLQGQGLLCRSVVQLPLGGTAPGNAVAAQQKATVALAATIASAIRSGGARASSADPAVQLQGCTSS
ncbi:ABC-type transport auxiliary lipoprotein component domain-containing protein [Bordetella sputigena]|uniref:PqiC family protein n=1 Tax=Bordetella sputigena TaxID=1416810 RepID=UPI0039EFF806